MDFKLRNIGTVQATINAAGEVTILADVHTLDDLDRLAEDILTARLAEQGVPVSILDFTAPMTVAFVADRLEEGMVGLRDALAWTTSCHTNLMAVLDREVEAAKRKIDGWNP